MGDGRAVIVDHKSAPIKLENCADYAGHYSEQLIAYREMIEATGTVVDTFSANRCYGHAIVIVF